MGQLRRSEKDWFGTDDQVNLEAEAMVVLINTLVGELSQSITVVSGLGEILLFENDRNSEIVKDLTTILKQTERMRDTLKSVKYVSDYGPNSHHRSNPI